MTTSRSIVQRAAAIFVAAMIISGCVTSRSNNFVAIINNTRNDIEVRMLGEDDVVGVSANNTNYIGLPEDGCQGAGLAAYNQQGIQIARLDQPPCAGDRWYIERDGRTRLNPSLWDE